MIQFMLCQDCLAISPIENDALNGKKHCVCGGEWCSCYDCQETIFLLRIGVRDPRRLGLQDHITEPISWDPDFGCKYPGSK